MQWKIRMGSPALCRQKGQFYLSVANSLANGCNVKKIFFNTQKFFKHEFDPKIWKKATNDKTMNTTNHAYNVYPKPSAQERYY